MAVRGGKRAGRSRIGTLLVLVGLVGVLGGTFGLGFLAGRHWPRVQVLLGLARPSVQLHAAADASAPPAPASPQGDKRHASGDTRGRYEAASTRADAPGGSTARADTSSEPPATAPAESRSEARPPALDTPRLTFYQELTAPLASLPRSTPPDGSRSAKSGSSPAAGRSDRSTMREPAESPGAERGEGTATRPPEVAPAAGQRFAIQVAAYTTPSQADALRGRLAAKGFDAAVSEVETSSGTRWRVRVGSYVSRDDARAAAERLGAQTKLDAIVVRAIPDGGR